MYNERGNVGPCLRRLDAFLRGVPARTAIIAVDDGSGDGTLDELRQLSPAISGLMIEARPRNGGYGAANRTGFSVAVREGFEYALVMDADGTQDPAFIGAFLAPMRAGVAFIKATRYARGGRVVGVGRRRYLISWAGNRLTQAVLRCGLTDYTNGFRAIRTSLLKRLETHDTGFAMLLEEVCAARRLGATFAEVPYTLTVRKDDESASKFSYSWSVYMTYLKYLFRR